MPIRHNRKGVITEIKVRFAPPAMCRLTVNNLKTIREERGLLQEDLASATGFCTKTIGRVERGERAPSAEFMLRIAAYFNLLVEDVFMLEEH